MGTFLRVLAILLLPLTIACLILGILLFDRREMLKGRTQKLEDTLMKLAPVIELETATLEAKPEHTPRDISSCTSQIIADPDTSDFWITYKDHLELTDQDVMDLKSQEPQLACYYKLEPPPLGDGKKRAKDINKNYITTGDGTMQPLLDDIIARAEAQLDRMNETREQLLVIRQELETTITELNTTKVRLREALNTIVQKDAEIRRLNGVIDGLNREIEGLKGDIAELEDTVRERDHTITVLEEKLADRNLEIKQQAERIRLLMIKIRQGTDTAGEKTPVVLVDGVKGTVIAIDNKWKFVVLELSEEFKDEVTRESREGRIDLNKLNIPFDLFRPAAKGGEYVTRINLREAKINEGIGIADILIDWQQLPVLMDDEAIR